MVRQVQQGSSLRHYIGKINPRAHSHQLRYRVYPVDCSSFIAARNDQRLFNTATGMPDPLNAVALPFAVNSRHIQFACGSPFIDQPAAAYSSNNDSGTPQLSGFSDDFRPCAGD
ncbi:hypothetical protein D3C75_576250 [compost metagenome]